MGGGPRPRSEPIGRGATLLALRGLPSALTLEGLLDAGFTLLAERPREEIVLGLVGKFWRASGDVRRVPGADFAALDEPGWAKAAWNFSLHDGPPGAAVLATETRVRCTDPASRRQFLRYWRVIRPLSGLIRRAALRRIGREAQRSRW